MKTSMFGFLAETAIHCGAGRSAGLIDLPVAREATTDYPFIAGSGLKGALRDRARSIGLLDSQVDALFGKQEHAGTLLVSDARLLLLPVRSLMGAYRWITCPHLLERYRRDLVRCGLPANLPTVTVSGANGVAGALTAGDAEPLYLEEREFAVTGSYPVELAAAISRLIRHEDTRKRLADQCVVVGDDEFSWFCRYALPIQARNELDSGATKRTADKAKKSTNVWFEESLPPDTVLYALATSRDGSPQAALDDLFPHSDPYLQVGGNETVGHGWVAVSIQPDGAGS